MDETVRETRRADELKLGDWLRLDENGALKPNEVVAVFQYPTGRGPRVHLTTQVPGRDPYSSDSLPLESTYELVTEAELAELREQAERAQKIADIRAFADWLESNPDVAMPYGLGGQQDVNSMTGQCTAEDVATVHAFAAKFGAPVVEVDSQTRAEHKVGHVRYTLIAWHESGRPTEPESDPTGQTYTRADDEPNDPTPVSGARVEPHVGAMTDEGLVDETPVEPVTHFSLRAIRTECDLAVLDLPLGDGWTNVGGHVTCQACLDAMPQAD